MKVLLKISAIFLFLSIFTAEAAAQSRFPEMKIPRTKISAKTDTSGIEERPYFLLIEQSEKALEEQDYEAAGLRLVEAMGVEPDNPLNVALLANLGMIYYYNEQDSMALVTLNVACERAPRLVAAHENRARVLIGMGRDKEAYDDYGRIIEIDSINTNARYYHGMMALFNGDLLTAETDFAVLDRVVPLWRNTMLANATMYSMTGRDREAISLFRKLIDKERLPEYYSSLAGCLIAVDDLGEASRVIGEGLELYKSDPELYYYRALLNHKRFMEDEAHKDAKKAIELGASPKRVAAIFMKGKGKQ